MEHPKTYFQKALKKYGFKNFKRTTLAIFDTAEEAYALEEKLVTVEFIKRPDTYNLALGGGKGSDYYKLVYQFDFKGTLLNIWDNNTIAAEAVGVQQPSISRAILEKGSCVGYYWSRTKTININEYTNHTGKEVFQYSPEGVLVNTFASLSQAAKAVDDVEKSLYRATQSQMMRKGFYWSFKQVDLFKPTKVSLRGTTVFVYSLDGKFVQALDSPKRIKEFFNMTHYGNLKSAILNRKPYCGYQVTLDHVDSLPPVTPYSNNTAKTVGCYDAEGNLVQTFPSIKQAIKVFGTKVVKVIRKQKSSLNGYTFKVL